MGPDWGGRLEGDIRDGAYGPEASIYVRRYAWVGVRSERGEGEECERVGLRVGVRTWPVGSHRG